MEPISRRTLLIGGGAAALATAGALAWEGSRPGPGLPGSPEPRREGEVDQPGVRWVPASDANMRRAERPADFPIERVVIHVTQASFATTLDVFRDPRHEAASHYVVPAHGGRVVQMVREMDVAFHAGNLEYNNTSVGIEHEGFIDRPQDFTASMYRESARVTAGVCKRYAIPVDRRHIIGHSQVPQAPGERHMDPGPHWDWDRYMRYVRSARSALG